MRTALIVEDEPEANKLLSMLVQLHGYATESAFTGSEALEKVRIRVPDVVFLDLMLPDLDGYEVCRALKSSGTTSQVPIVIVTARIAAENRIESFHAGADDYVPKPYTPDQIFEALDQSNTRGRESTAHLIEGEVVLDGRDEGDTLRSLARLRGLLLARSMLEPEAVELITTAIRAIWSSVDGWARRSGLDRVATLAYAHSPGNLVLTVHDEAGWLAHMGDLAEAPVTTILTDGRFDQIEIDHEAHCLRLVKRFRDV
jgi:DNA-binding response OmpR family regulator